MITQATTMTVTSDSKKNSLLGIITVLDVQKSDDILVFFYPWHRLMDLYKICVRRNKKGELRLTARNLAHSKECFRMIAMFLQYEDRPFTSASDVYAHPAWELLCDCVDSHRIGDTSIFDVYNTKPYGVYAEQVDDVMTAKHEVTAKVSGSFTFENAGIETIKMPVKVSAYDKIRGVRFDLQFTINATPYGVFSVDTYLLNNSLKRLSLIDFSAVRKAILLALESENLESSIEGDFREHEDALQPIEQYEKIMSFCIARMKSLPSAS